MRGPHRPREGHRPAAPSDPAPPPPAACPRVPSTSVATEVAVSAAHAVFLATLWACLSCLCGGLGPETFCDLRIPCPPDVLLKLIVIRPPKNTNPLVRAFLHPYRGKTCQGVLRHIHNLGKRRNHPEKVTHLTKPPDLHFYQTPAPRSTPPKPRPFSLSYPRC